MQRRLSVYSKMQECYEQQQQQQQTGGRGMPSRDQAALGAGSRRRSTSDSDQKDSTQPTETEYLGSRCVLFTYFQGEIGDVVDEHFSRALSQSSTFSGNTKQIRVSQSSASNGSWKGALNYFTFKSSHWASSLFVGGVKVLFRFRLRVRGSERPCLERRLSSPVELLPSIPPPRFHPQPGILQPSGRDPLGRPCAHPGQPPTSGHSAWQLGLQPELPELERLPQCPQHLPSPPSPPPHPAPPPHAPFIPDPQPDTGSQVQPPAAAQCQEPEPGICQHRQSHAQRGGEDGDGPQRQQPPHSHFCHLEPLCTSWIIRHVRHRYRCWVTTTFMVYYIIWSGAKY